MNLKSYINIQFRTKTLMPSLILGNPPKTEKWLGRRLPFAIHKLLRGLVRLNDTPFRIAMGCSCGIFCSTLPVFGQTFLAILLARLFRANVIASIPWSWISNPLTTLPIWYGGYRLGIWLLSEEDQSLSYAEIDKLSQEFEKMDWVEKLSLFSSTFFDTLHPLWLGTLVMGIMMAIPGFCVAYWLVDRVQHQQAR
jgi:uncharacterized protein (DUF2062 family)